VTVVAYLALGTKLERTLTEEPSITFNSGSTNSMVEAVGLGARILTGVEALLCDFAGKTTEVTRIAYPLSAEEASLNWPGCASFNNAFAVFISTFFTS
jgi:hypothetical protein